MRTSVVRNAQTEPRISDDRTAKVENVAFITAHATRAAAECH